MSCTLQVPLCALRSDFRRRCQLNRHQTCRMDTYNIACAARTYMRKYSINICRLDESSSFASLAWNGRIVPRAKKIHLLCAMHNNHADEQVTLRSYYAALPEKNNRIAGTRCEKHFSFIQPGNRFEGNVNAHSTRSRVQGVSKHLSDSLAVGR